MSKVDELKTSAKTGIWKTESLTEEERAMEKRVQEKTEEARRILSRNTLIHRLVFFVGVLVLWEVLSGPVIDPFFVSAPIKIMGSWFSETIYGNMIFHAEFTLIEALGGYLLGTMGGILCAFLLAYFPSLFRMLQPFIVGFYGVPRIAMAPLFIMWFGIGFISKVAVATLIVFFVNFINTSAGIRNVSQDLLNVVSVMGANPFQKMWKIQLPSAMPFIMAGLRVSVPSCMIGAIVGEFISSNRGVGFMIIDSQSEWDIAGVFAAIFTIFLMVLCLNAVVSFMERKFLRWRPQESGEITTGGE